MLCPARNHDDPRNCKRHDQESAMVADSSVFVAGDDCFYGDWPRDLSPALVGRADPLQAIQCGFSALCHAKTDQDSVGVGTTRRKDITVELWRRAHEPTTLHVCRSALGTSELLDREGNSMKVAPKCWAKKEMVDGAGCGVEGFLDTDGSADDGEVPLYDARLATLFQVAITTLQQIESTPRNAGARRNARATIRFIETQLAV